MALPRQLLPLFAVLVSAAACSAAAQPATAEAAPDSSPAGVGIKVSFRPSVAIVVGIFTMIFSLTFLLLMYAKFCHSSSSPLPTAIPTAAAANGAAAAAATAPPQAGVPKPVIEALPFFRFATLRGARQGMECSVCLARFDDADHLRLLPRCRHAFHLACVDRWLESNASCPLCRARVDAGDASLGLKYPSSARIVFGADDGLDDGVGSGRDLLDIFVERVPSARFAAGPPKRAAAGEEEEAAPELDRHRHRIIVSDVVFKSRWSELNSADLPVHVQRPLLPPGLPGVHQRSGQAVNSRGGVVGRRRAGGEEAAAGGRPRRRAVQQLCGGGRRCRAGGGGGEDDILRGAVRVGDREPAAAARRGEGAAVGGGEPAVAADRAADGAVVRRPHKEG
ncbi:unnamed protein product [Urochloa humidicola]